MFYLKSSGYPHCADLSDGKLHDVHALDMLLPEAGAIYVVDRGYVDFARLYVLHQAGAFFVTRAKSNIDAHRVYSAPTDRSTGIICDQTISLDGFYTRQDYPELLRRIRFKDPESGKTLVFITNNFSLPAATICALYKSRWQVELFFKWIKQHLRIKQFYGTSENAVKTQIWIAVSVYVLVAIARLKPTLYPGDSIRPGAWPQPCAERPGGDALAGAHGAVKGRGGRRAGFRYMLRGPGGTGPLGASAPSPSCISSPWRAGLKTLRTCRAAWA